MKPRILVVDDYADAADSLAMLLSLSGYETRVAYTGPDAIAIAAELHPQIAFLDLLMPGMDGFQPAARLRAAEPDCRLVAVSGYGQVTDAAKRLLAGFSDHIFKPAEPRDILAIIENSVVENAEFSLSMTAPMLPTH